MALIFLFSPNNSYSRKKILVREHEIKSFELLNQNSIEVLLTVNQCLDP